LNKLLITIQGRTLILYYQVKKKLERKGSGGAHYIEVLPSADLSRFDLKGLTPEMFCVNIADMVNIRGLYSGQVENERQLPVAKWKMNYEEYLQIKNFVSTQLTHKQIVGLLESLPGYMQESDNQYIEFEESVVPQETGFQAACSGYRLTIMTEEIEEHITSSAFYYLDTYTPSGWQGCPPPQTDYDPVKIALKHKLDAIREAGVTLVQVSDETDYAIVMDMSIHPG
jgi:hypothetical protein